MYMRNVMLLVFCFLFVSSVFAILPSANIKLLAVTTEGVGTDANLIISTKSGTGQVWSSIDSLVGTMTQNTEKTSVELLSKYFKESNNYDYFFNINSTAREVDGPSAGLSTALLLIYMAKDKTLPNYVSGTGTISSSGQIGKVGGILEKTKYAASTGIKIFFVPKSELEVVIKENNDVKKVNLSNYALEKYNIKVIGVDTIDEVLSYNLNNIENISIPDFNTETKLIYDPLTTNPIDNLTGFQNYLSDYEKEVNANIELTESLLKSSDIKDNDLLNELYSSYNDAKDIYNSGKSAYEKNYLYSSANQFFLANRTLNFIIDLLNNPDLENDVKKINELTQKLLIDYNYSFENMPCNNYEWSIASQERYLWANKNINTILNTVSIDRSDNYNKLLAYEEAKEWLKISKLFLSYTSIDNCNLDQTQYKQSAEQMLGELKKADNLITKYDLSNSEKWINGAIDANKNKWYFASIFESATALAIINSHLETKDENLESMKVLLTNLLNELDSKKNGFVWSNLYLQHSNYTYNEAKFYEDNNNLDNALATYKQSYELAVFSKNLLDVVEDIEKNKQSISYVSNAENTIKVKKNIADWDLYKTLAFVMVLVILIMIFIVIIFYNKVRQNNLSQYKSFIELRIEKLKSFLLQIENDYKTNKISQSNYKTVTKDCLKEIEFLEYEKKLVETKISEIVRLEREISDKHIKLNNLKERYTKNEISLDEYIKDIKTNDLEMKSLKRKIDSDIKEVSESIISKPEIKYNYKPNKKKTKKGLK